MITLIDPKAQKVKAMAQETTEEAKEKAQKAIKITGGSLIGIEAHWVSCGDFGCDYRISKL